MSLTIDVAHRAYVTSSLHHETRPNLAVRRTEMYRFRALRFVRNQSDVPFIAQHTVGEFLRTCAFRCRFRSIVFASRAFVRGVLSICVNSDSCTPKTRSIEASSSSSLDIVSYKHSVPV